MSRATGWRLAWLVSGLMVASLLFTGAALAEGSSPAQSSLSAPSGTEVSDWHARWELARLLSFAKRYDEALAEYDRLLREKPGEQAVRMEKARVLFWAGRPQEAMRLFETIPQQQLADADRLAMADILVGLKEYERAKAIYLEYLGRMPADHAVRLKLAELYGWLKQYDASLREYRQLLEALPNDMQLRRKYAQTLSWAGQREEAIRQLQQTLTPTEK